MTNRIYIAGPMSGLPDYNRPAFREAEERLRALGFQQIENPCKLDPSLPYKTLIDHGLRLLRDCDTLYLLDGWYNSKGARLEHQYAITVGMEISYPNE